MTRQPAVSGTAKPNIGKLLKELENAYSRAVDMRMRMIGLTKTQSDVLYQLYQNASLTQRDICRINNVTEATLSVLISGLERKGLLKRESDTADPRKKRLILTPSAEHLRKAVIDIKVTVYNALVADMSEKRLAGLASDLRQLLGNLEQLG